MAIAKTFKSEQPDFFTKPQGLNDFGILIPGAPQYFTLGLEEFNFCDILNKFKFQGKHVAYIPPFSTNWALQIARNYNCLHLMFHNGAAGGVTHYATMHKVSRIPDNPDIIIELRKALTTAGLPNYVNVGSGNWPNYNPYPGLQNAALNIWNQCFMANNIIAPNGVNRFVVNMFYECITFHKTTPNNRSKEWSKRALHAANFYTFDTLDCEPCQQFKQITSK